VRSADAAQEASALGSADPPGALSASPSRMGREYPMGAGWPNSRSTWSERWVQSRRSPFAPRRRGDHTRHATRSGVASECATSTPEREVPLNGGLAAVRRPGAALI
jgi:hypothetical protein